MRALGAFLRTEKQAGRVWYPAASRVLAALELCPLENVRCVIVGQDPYHRPGQAIGLAFAVPDALQPKPPSLRNIYRELESDLGAAPERSDLTPWARDGVLLLNSVLTVSAGLAGSHAGRGWEAFTDTVIQRVNDELDRVCFLLWGRHAQAKGARIDRRRHLVLEAAHPSPLSARAGFFGCRHFSRANDFLVEHGREPIDWSMANAPGSRSTGVAIPPQAPDPV